MNLTPDHLLSKLRQIPVFADIPTWWLAYSGGLDSQVLLQLLSQLPITLRAVYVDHGLQAASAQWAQHCEQSCEALGVPFQVVAVDASAAPRQSPEAAARQARYAALQSLMQPGDCLLTAHHQDDQGETLLLQLFRGAGIKGVAAMPFFKAWGKVYHARPLLDLERADLRSYAEAQGLRWVEDPSNEQSRYDRNYLRHHVMPLLKQRWPSVLHNLHRYASHQGESDQLLQQLAQLDLQAFPDHRDSLSIEALAKLDPLRQKNLLRYWLTLQGQPLPSAAILDEILKQVVQGSDDNRARVQWAGVEARHFQRRMYVIPCLAHDAGRCYPWKGDEPLAIETLYKVLQAQPWKGGLQPGIQGRDMQIKFRQGGEVIQPAGRSQHHTLKKLFQEAGVPSWERDRIPLLYLDDKLIAVAGYWVDASVAVDRATEGWMPLLETADV